MIRSAVIALALALPALTHAQVLAQVLAQTSCPYTGGAATIPTPGAPFAAQPSADGCWLFAAVVGPPQGARAGLAVFHLEGGQFHLARLVPIKGVPGGLALSHDGKTLVVSAEDNLALLDIARLETAQADPLIADLPQGEGAGAVYVITSLDDRLLFVSEEHRAELAVYDLARARAEPGAKPKDLVIGLIPQGLAPVGLALSPDGRRLYATSEVGQDAFGYPKHCALPNHPRPQSEGALTVIDVDRAAKDPARSVIALAPAGCSPVRVVLSPDGTRAWVTARAQDELLAFDTAQLQGKVHPAPVARIKVGVAPVGVAVRPDGRQVWVANSDRFSASGAGSLTQVPADGPPRTVASGKFPRDLRFLPDGKTLVVAQFGSSAIQFAPTDAP